METLTITLTPATHRQPCSLCEQLWFTVRTWYRRVRQRRQLAALSDWQLDDIGISRVEAQREAGKAFWRV